MTDLVEEARKMLEGTSPGPWKGCKEGDCTCGQIWSITGDHPVAAVEYAEWGDTWFVAAPTEEDPEAVERRFSAYGSFPESERYANAKFIAWARNNVPEMIETITSLRAEVKSLRGE